MINCRPATLNDLPTLLEFEQGIVEAERPYDSTLKAGHINYYDLQEFIEADDKEVIVAEENNEILGSGHVRIRQSKAFRKHDRHAFLGFMFVRPEHRGRGINQRITDSLIEWAVSRGITEIQLDVYDENIAAIKAYEKSGFAKDIVTMRKELK